MKRNRTQLLKIILCAFMTLTLLSITACTDSSQFYSPKKYTASPSRAMEMKKVPLVIKEDGKQPAEALVQAVIYAINGDYPVEDIFASLGNEQKSDLTEDEFRLYIKSLKPVSGEKIKTFIELDPLSKEHVVTRVLREKPLMIDLILNSRYYALHFGEESAKAESGQEKYIVLGIQQSATGTAYFDSAWVREVNKLYDFGSFYFHAIQHESLGKGDYGALSYLIQSTKPPFKHGDFVAYASYKAERISEFYNDFVITPATKSLCLTALPGVIRFRQGVSHTGGLSGTREVWMYENDNQYRIVEPISESLPSSEKNFMIYNDPLFTNIANYQTTLSSRELHPLVGPLLNLEELVNAETGDTTYRVTYLGLTIEFKGLVNKEDRFWQGTIEEMRFNSAVLKMGDNVVVGMSEEAFHHIFPFYLDNNRTFSTSGVLRNFRINYRATNGRITELVFTRVRGN